MLKCSTKPSSTWLTNIKKLYREIIFKRQFQAPFEIIFPGGARSVILALPFNNDICATMYLQNKKVILP